MKFKLVPRLYQIDIISNGGQTIGFGHIFLDGTEGKIYGVAGKQSLAGLKDCLKDLMDKLGIVVIHGQFTKEIYHKLIEGTDIPGIGFSYTSMTEELGHEMVNVEFWREEVECE